CAKLVVVFTALEEFGLDSW
nr:immunoglobulin heavy chain junction region [Macaca mulatta]MOW22739.1 immunoglobulin heavy chain junction region [Macaca mulatta]MOW22761.1 immunoglobulin heavy chain junction region [Macaca mulatta]MOW22956.1 immunoglobulin heavy chain junction region [Macaca mulatta]MOW23095.1 immunoglobulin heavy chain junction region [Macaca mulatta]